MLGGGTLLFLALVSFQPSDVPGWLWYSQAATKNGASQNLVGNVGAIVAGFFFFALGAASFLVAALLLLFGLAKLFFSRLRLLPRLPWMIGFVITGACLLHLQHWFLRDWQQQFNGISTGLDRSGAGGWLGLTLGEKVLERWLLGSVGSLIVLGTIYVCCMILMTGLHPIALGRRAVEGLQFWSQELLRRQREARLARTTERERLLLEQKRLAKEQQRLEKQLRRQGVVPPPGAATDSSNSPGSGGAPAPSAISRFEPPVAAGAEEDEFAHLPPPKITDNSAPPPAVAGVPGKKKPSLLEAMSARARATAALQGGSNGGHAAADGGADIRFANYELPDIDLLDTREVQDHQSLNEKELMLIQGKIVETLEQFGIKVSPGDITRGPTITRYEVYPAKGVRVDKIVSLEKDIARATRAERINILAPIPGKDTVGIEIANSKKVKVTLRELLEGVDWTEAKAKIPIALGKDVYGKTIIADLAAMPHCLIAGATGSGKSVCINSIIASLLYKFTPEQLRLVMIDPKVVELQIYNDLPHLVVPVVTDPKKVLLALRWVIDEMMKRYELFAKTGVRNITSFNARPKPKSQAELDAEADAAAAAAALANGTAGEKSETLLTDAERRRRDGRRREAPGAGGWRDAQRAGERAHSGADAVHRRHRGRAGRSHADRAGGRRKRHRPHHPDGARGRHPHDHRHPDAARRRHHRRHQGQRAQPHRLSGGQRARFPRHPGRKRRRATPRPRRYALPPAGHQPACARARCLCDGRGSPPAREVLRRPGRADV